MLLVMFKKKTPVLCNVALLNGMTHFFAFFEFGKGQQIPPQILPGAEGPGTERFHMNLQHRVQSGVKNQVRKTPRREAKEAYRFACPF